jgi:hypothetical protein
MTPTTERHKCRGCPVVGLVREPPENRSRRMAEMLSVLRLCPWAREGLLDLPDDLVAIGPRQA